MVRIGIGIGRHRGLCINLLFIFGYTYLDIVGNWYAEVQLYHGQLLNEIESRKIFEKKIEFRKLTFYP